MVDGVTCMAFTISFVPNTGNKYFMAACDEHLRLYDFEQAMVRQKKKEKKKRLRTQTYYFSFYKHLKTCILPIVIVVNL